MPSNLCKKVRKLLFAKLIKISETPKQLPDFLYIQANLPFRFFQGKTTVFTPHPSLNMTGSPMNTRIKPSEGCFCPLTHPSLNPSL